jgi:hypothetical protein
MRIVEGQDRGGGNTNESLNFMRSAIEPTMSAGVMMANIIWNMA